MRKDGLSDKIKSVLKEPRINSQVIVKAVANFSVQLKRLLINLQVAVRELFKHELQSIEAALISVETCKMEAISVRAFDRCDEILGNLLNIRKHISSVQLSYRILHLRKGLFPGFRDRKLQLSSFHISPFVVVSNQQIHILCIKFLNPLQFHLVSYYSQDIHMTCVCTQMEDTLSLAILLVQVCAFLQEIQHADRTVVKCCILQKRLFLRIRRLEGLIA